MQDEVHSNEMTVRKCFESNDRPEYDKLMRLEMIFLSNLNNQSLFTHY